MFKSHKILRFCLILLALLGFTAQAQAEPQTFIIQVGDKGGPPEPDPFFWGEVDVETTRSILVWADSKQLEFGPGKKGFFIDLSGNEASIPFVGVLLDAGLNPISNTTFGGLTNIDAAQIDVTESIRFSGIQVSLGGSAEFNATYVFLWLTKPKVVKGDAVGNQPPIADAGGTYNRTAGVGGQLDGSRSEDPDGSIAEYSWDFGDSTPLGSGERPTHTWAEPGTYNVTLTVTDGNGATDSDSTTANISRDNAPPVADAGGGISKEYNGTVGVPLQFDGSGSTDDVGIVSYTWWFNDGSTTEKGVAPLHTYTYPGGFAVRLDVKDAEGETDTNYADAIIGEGNQPPQADAGPPVVGASNVPVAFDASGSSDPDGSIVQYDWDFGDDTSMDDAGPTPSHTYTASSNYTVTLTVTDDNDAQDSDFTTTAIDPDPIPPKADAGGPYSGTEGVAVSFDGSASSDDDGTIASYEWSFGDRGTGTSPKPSHTYAEPGNYTVTLTVTDNDGLTNLDTTQATIADGNQPPTANPNGPYLGKVNVPVTFDGSASDDPDGTIEQYDWDYGDGTIAPAAGPTPTHTYKAASLYRVILTVTDDDGLPVSNSTTARIGESSQPPTADANGPYRGQGGVPVTFDGSASDDPDGSITLYEWDFDDGNTGTGETPSNTYEVDGKYWVTLTVTDDTGETDTDFTFVIVARGQQPPQADAGDSVSGKVGRRITFDGSGSSDPDGTIERYDWDYGDGTPIDLNAGPTPNHIYTASANYTVTLKVYSDGLTDSDLTLAVIESRRQCVDECRADKDACLDVARAARDECYDECADDNECEQACRKDYHDARGECRAEKKECRAGCQ